MVEFTAREELLQAVGFEFSHDEGYEDVASIDEVRFNRILTETFLETIENAGEIIFEDYGLRSMNKQDNDIKKSFAKKLIMKLIENNSDHFLKFSIMGFDKENYSLGIKNLY